MAEAAGPLVAKYTRPGQVRRGTLEVVVANSTLMQELGFQKRDLLDALARAPAGRRDQESPLPRGEYRIE